MLKLLPEQLLKLFLSASCLTARLPVILNNVATPVPIVHQFPRLSNQILQPFTVFEKRVFDTLKHVCLPFYCQLSNFPKK